MNANINKTKKHLSIVFATIVFVVVLILGITFLSVKYFKEITFEEKDFTIRTSVIQNSGNNYNALLNQLPKFDKFSPWERKAIKWNFEEKDFLNFILVDKSNVVKIADIRENVTEDFIINILQNNSFLKLTQHKWYFVKKIILEDESQFIIFKKLRYDLIDYIEDVSYFILISFLFSFLIYLIWTSFVDKIFIPVENNIKDMSDFIHNAGHELKTPLSVIDSNIQLIKDMKTYDESMIDELKDEVIKLNSLIDSLIKLSDIDLFKETQEINLDDLVWEILNDFKSKIDEKKITITKQIKQDITLTANKSYAYIFISNIIWNAIKYNKIMWKIDIKYKNNFLIIKDTWIGIKRDDITKIWDRFYKSDNSRNTPGFGIWLSLVKKIGDIYNWKISVDSEENIWTKFSIKF